MIGHGISRSKHIPSCSSTNQPNQNQNQNPKPPPLATRIIRETVPLKTSFIGATRIAHRQTTSPLAPLTKIQRLAFPTSRYATNSISLPWGLCTASRRSHHGQSLENPESLASPDVAPPSKPHTVVGDMAPDANAVLPAARPIRNIVDPWNSSSTGHQRADNRLAGSTAWRQSRTWKLAHQYGAGPGGGERIPDTVGAGSMGGGTDGRWENGDGEAGAPGCSESGSHDIRSFMRGEGKRKGREERPSGVVDHDGTRKEREDVAAAHEAKPERRKIFHDLRIYINGSTAPMVSDHRLKQLLVEHGAQIRLALGRRSVTHVILGTPNGARGGVQGAGGGLAAGKIQREIKRVGGCGVKYVGVEWVLESIQAGKRLPEARFANLSTAAHGQKSVVGWFAQPVRDPDAIPVTTGLEHDGSRNDQLARRFGIANDDRQRKSPTKTQ